jgi:hypothetical protein
LGLPHDQIEGIIEAHNFASHTFAIKDCLSLWICTERSCCPGLREYLSGWVDLIGKHPSPRSFVCWCFGPWVVWSHVHFVSWLVMGFIIFSWLAQCPCVATSVIRMINVKCRIYFGKKNW